MPHGSPAGGHRGRRAGPRKPRLGACVCGVVPRRARPPRPARQQRRRDGAAAARDGGRVRAPVRHQPPRSLCAHGAADRRDGGERRRARRDHQQRGASHGKDQLRRPAEHAPLQPLARVRAVEACEPAVRFRARPPPACRGLRHQEPRRPPGLLRDEPAVRRAAEARPDGDGGDQPPDRAERGDGRAAAALRRDQSGRRGRPVHRARRDRRAARTPRSRSARAAPRATKQAARRLWEVSEELTGVSFELPVAQSEPVSPKK